MSLGSWPDAAASDNRAATMAVRNRVRKNMERSVLSGLDFLYSPCSTLDKIHSPPRTRLSEVIGRNPVTTEKQCECRLVSKQAAVASVVFVDVQTMLLDNLGSSSQCCCDGRIANVWQRLDENFLDFFQCEAVIEPGPHVDGEFMGLTHGNHDGHRN